MKKTKNIALLGVLLALGLGLAWVESLLPPMGLPGVKLGLGNLVTLLALYWLNPWLALGLAMGRSLLAALLFSGFSGLLFSLSGAVLAWAGMMLLMKIRRFSPLGISAAGGVLHNLGQLLMAALITKSPGVIPAYLPVLLASGVAAGCVNGVIARLVLRAMEHNKKTGKNE